MPKKKKRVAIDLRTLDIPHMKIEGKGPTPKDLIEIYLKEDILIYDGSRGNAPIFIDDDVEVMLLDISKVDNLDEALKQVKK